MAVNASDSAAQRYANNTDGDEWQSEVNDADVDGDEWVDGLADKTDLENTDQLDGSIWADEFGVDDEDADEYEAETTAQAWADGWGDVEEWDI
jgi:hypothetical protein